MSEHEWIKEFPGAVTVCDPLGMIIEMNDKAAQSFESDGGYALLGQNVLDCHPEQARLKIQRLFAAHQENVYTIEKNGVKKLVFQSPWFKDSQFAGIVELVIEIPFEVEHFIRS